MNKAAFLNIVRQVAPIQDQEVDDLERLVVSFPYCQTAHVLLAKAAYDRGSMLSTQKLRRAAAHVSNRQLLKQLVYATPVLEETSVYEEEETEIEATVSGALSENEPLNEELLEEVEEVQPFSLNTEPLVVAPEEPLSSSNELEESIEVDGIDLDESILEGPSVLLPEESELEAESSFLQPESVTEEAYSESDVSLEEEVTSPLIEPLSISETPEETHLVTSEALPALEEPETQEAQDEIEELEAEVTLSEEEDNLDELLELIQISSLASFSTPTPAVNLSHEEIMVELTSSPVTEVVEEPALDFEPAIDFEKVVERLSAPEKEETLVEAEEEGLSAYLEIAKLDSLYDTSGYEFPTLKLPEVAPGTSSQDEATQDPYLSIFTQNNLAYWMGSSRLGESIQLKDDLTTTTPFFFQPELIIEHVKEKKAPEKAPEVSPAAKLDIQLDIINQFLKTTPKRKTLANAQLNNEPQEDLSAKSSKIKKTLVSENLALIFVKQGKARKAVKIYEQLIVKFPEKKSYFAEQIEKLRNE